MPRENVSHSRGIFVCTDREVAAVLPITASRNLLLFGAKSRVHLGFQVAGSGYTISAAYCHEKSAARGPVAIPFLGWERGRLISEHRQSGSAVGFSKLRVLPALATAVRTIGEEFLLSRLSMGVAQLVGESDIFLYLERREYLDALNRMCVGLESARVAPSGTRSTPRRTNWRH